MFIPLSDDVENKHPPITGMFLVLANLLAYAYELRLFLDDPKMGKLTTFIKTWGLTPYALQHGDYLGLLTHMFLHGDFMHLLGNMVVLWAFARSLEGALGSVNLAFLYVIWGFGAAGAHAAMNWGDKVPMIGASGAIAGVIGAYFMIFGSRTKIKSMIFIAYRPFIVHIPATAFVAIWVGMQMLGVIMDSESGQQTGVAWYAHLGGFCAGAASMMLIGKNVQRQLVCDKHGELRFEEVASADGAAVAAVPAVAALAPASLSAGVAAAANLCPHCGTDLGASNRMASNLLQCTNQECKRLVYLN